MTDWVSELEVRAPDLVAAWRGIEVGKLLSVRREVRERAGQGSVARTLEQLAATADALAAIVERLPEGAFAEPGGEGDWNVAQAIGHVATARSGLVIAAGLAASGRWPADASPVVPGVPGPPGSSRADLLGKLDKSRRVIARTAQLIAGHESDPCPLDHPLVGRLRCGEWLFFAGVHDLMHLEQLHAIAMRSSGYPTRAATATGGDATRRRRAPLDSL
jgi:DinB superfamily